MPAESSPEDVLAPLLARIPGFARLLPRLPGSRLVEQSLRDLTMVTTTLLRYRPVARTYERTGTREVHTSDTLTVEANEPAAEGTRTITFTRPPGFVFSAGQFLTLCLTVPGVRGELRRSYSICSAPGEDTLRIAVKRARNGAGSAYLHGLAVGSKVAFRGPSGTFVYAPRADAHRLLLIAGGSGVTPILSIVKTALSESPLAELTLFYAARRANEMAHREELQALAAASPRLALRCFFDELEHGADMATSDTLGRIGPLDLGPHASAAATVYLCGPEAMMDGVSGALQALGFPPETILRERFFTPRPAPLPARKERVSLELVGRARELAVDTRRTLLESALEASVPLPYSCTMGGCGQCKARLSKGQVSMAEPNCLSRQEREDGFILPCISYPLTDVALEYPELGSPPHAPSPGAQRTPNREENDR